MGDRAGRGGGDAPAGLPVWLRGQQPGDHPFAGSVQLLSGRRFRPQLPVVYADRPRRNINVSRLAARPHVTAGVGGFVDITANARNIVISGTFTAGARLAVADGRLRIEREGKVRKFVHEVEHVTFSGRRARQTGQNVIAITERCVLRLDTDGWTVTEIAPGASLEKDVLAQCEFPLAVAPDLREMEARLFVPELMQLRLQGE